MSIPISPKVPLSDRASKQIRAYLLFKQTLHDIFSQSKPSEDQIRIDELTNHSICRLERVYNLSSQLVSGINKEFSVNQRDEIIKNNDYYSLTAFSENALQIAINLPFYLTLLRTLSVSNVSDFHSYIPLTYVGRFIKLSANRHVSFFAFLLDRIDKDPSIVNKEKVKYEISKLADYYYSLSCFRDIQMLENIHSYLNNLSKFIQQYFNVVHILLEERKNLSDSQRADISRFLELRLPHHDLIIFINLMLELTKQIVPLALFHIEPIHERPLSISKYFESGIIKIDQVITRSLDNPFSLKLEYLNLLELICYARNSILFSGINKFYLYGYLNQGLEIILNPRSSVFDSLVFSSILIDYMTIKLSIITGISLGHVNHDFGIGSTEIIY